jgi:hypothetical protein
MKCIAGLFLLAATGMAQALLAPIDRPKPVLPKVPGRPAYQAMTGSERWKQYQHNYFTGAGAYFRSLNTASFGEAWGLPKGWPSTTGGFAERFGSSFARNAIQGSITDGMAAALGHDTRYVPCGCTGNGARIRYAMQMAVMTRNREGRKVFDVSRFAGMYGGALAMSAWRPHNLSGPADSARLTGIGLSTAFMTNLAREFSPELRQRLHTHHQLFAGAGHHSDAVP